MSSQGRGGQAGLPPATGFLRGLLNLLEKWPAVREIEVQGLPGIPESQKSDSRVARPCDAQLLFLSYVAEWGLRWLAVKAHGQASWAAETSPELLAHLQGDDERSLAAQMDVLPIDWTYPTSLIKREMVFEGVHLGLRGLPSGKYPLAVRAYHPGTKRRLPVSAETLTVRSNAPVPREVTTQ